MKKFSLKSSFNLTGDQPQAVEKIVADIKSGKKYHVLLGVTGSGKTFAVASVIKRLQIPVLVISHNKTLAAQLYQEFRDFFPKNAVSYFVSYYDYYQPESYLPATDTYIEKDADINEQIDKLRLSATTNILTRGDSMVVSSVSCIYNIGSPKEYGAHTLEMATKMKVEREQIIARLVALQYMRTDFDFKRGTFRVRGEVIDIYPAYDEFGVKIELTGNEIEKITKFNPLTGEVIEIMDYFTLFPSKHYMADREKQSKSFNQIRKDLEDQVKYFKSRGKELEANRIKQRVDYDLEMLNEVGYIKGIENYSRYFDGRNPGDPPFSLLDYFNEAYGENWLVVVDESHITFPQIRGMYAGDRSRKETLVEYGFRLPAAFDNRPLQFDEFLRRVPKILAISATPSEWEISMMKGEGGTITEQLVRPTGIIDPKVEIKKTETQVADVISEIKKETKKGKRTLVTTLTKRMAEDVSKYLSELGLKVAYLHSDIKTLERSEILDNLRKGDYDALIGVNLLREGLDLPEVTLVAILDADKEGFLRSRVSLIQTMGRAARNTQGRVIMYADKVTDSMKAALDEIDRRRKYQTNWNKKYKITPKNIIKPIRERLVEVQEILDPVYRDVNRDSLTPLDKKKVIIRLRREMKFAAESLNFELAAELRDKIKELE